MEASQGLGGTDVLWQCARERQFLPATLRVTVVGQGTDPRQ